ncbi:hypothetical protein ABMA28_001863 [Loxostege sticticalis]|uniref:U4/U6.U5 tri-snRNP-associated protein 1 n=1 Tax=Loxostege sticticalis TaxID=481309 RepID=A0ABD0SZ43_LOXSC
MGSKKHKKESKKKKHRSRSRSPLDGEERERKRHKKHKDRKKDRSPDVEEVPVDSHLARSRSRSASADVAERERERDRRAREAHRAQRDDRDKSFDAERSRGPSRSASPAPSGANGAASASGGAQESLSIEETNRLRAKLGLKPLEVAEKPADDGKFKDDLGEFYHKPATNITQQKKSEKLRERIDERREKRNIEQKLKTTLLAEEDDEEDALAWVKKSREIEKQKREAAKRAAMLDEMDEVFGVSALVAADERQERAEAYAPQHLRGLRVAHDIDALGDEREVVLTLADAPVLADDAEDVLVNVNIVDDEKYKKNIIDRKKAKAGYQAYDDEADLEAAALGYRKPVLSKYDEEIDKEAAARARGFVIGDEAAIEAKRFRDMLRQERLAGGVEKRLESLQLPALRLATDYLDDHEINAKFKKSKRKGKIRKKAKQEPIDVDDYDAGMAPLETDDTDVKPEQLKSELAVDEEETEPDVELQAALARARRMRQYNDAERRIPKVEEILEHVKEEIKEESMEPEEGCMVLDATAEFCRTLGDVPSIGLSGVRHERPNAEVERDDIEMEGAGAGGAWSRVDVAGDRPPDITAGSSVGLEAEPALGAGVAGALRLALSKGYLERAGPAPHARPHHHHLLAARHYSIEDKALGGEDDKYGRRERGGHSGPLQEFREKSNFRPNIKLEYADDDGRPLCPKEAFRYLSHKFHGKGPGKNKQEKRIKKAVQEGLMKKMSSTDTPLGTLQMLQDKQRETHSPYIVLQGAKRDNNT